MGGPAAWPSPRLGASRLGSPCPSDRFAAAVAALPPASPRARLRRRDAAAAGLCRLGELRRLPWARSPGVGGLGPRARLDAAERGDRARRLRRRASSRRRRHALHPPGRRLRGRDRGRRRGAAELRRGGGGRHPAAAAVPARARARADPGARHRLGHRAPAAGTTSIPTRSAARRRAALDRPLQELGGALRGVPRHRVTAATTTPATRSYAPAAWPRSASAARPATGRARRMPPGRRRRAAMTRRVAGADGARADRRSRGVGGGGDPAVRRLPFAARDLLRRQPAAGHAVSRQLQPGAAARRALRAGRADRGGGLRVRLVPAGEDVRAGRAVQRLPRSACGDAAGPRATRSAPSAIRRPATTGFRR